MGYLIQQLISCVAISYSVTSNKPPFSIHSPIRHDLPSWLLLARINSRIIINV